MIGIQPRTDRTKDAGEQGAHVRAALRFFWVLLLVCGLWILPSYAAEQAAAPVAPATGAPVSLPFALEQAPAPKTEAQKEQASNPNKDAKNAKDGAKAANASKDPKQSQTPSAPAPSTTAAELGGQLQALVTGVENGELEPQETFGTRALGFVLTFLQLMRQQSADLITRIGAWPQISAWLDQQVSNPFLADRWLTIAQRLIFVAGGALVAGFLADLLLLPVRRAFRRRQTESLGARIGVLSGWFLVSLIPVVVFLGAAGTLMDQGDPNKIVRFIVMTVIYALAVFQLIRLMTRFLVSPRSPHLRLIPMSSGQAAYLYRWVGLFSGVMIVGFFFPDVARVLRVPAPAIALFTNMIGLLIVGMTITIIVQKRALVSSFLRGDLWAGQSNLTLWQSLRLWLARVWHVLAIAYLVIGYVVTSLSSGGGFDIMQRGTLLTLLVLLGIRLALFMASKIGTSDPKSDTGQSMGGILRPVLQGLIRFAAWILGLAGIAAAWGADVSGFVTSPWGQRVLGSVFSITATIVLVVVIYEIIHAAIGRKLNKRDENGNIVINARAQTLLPMLHNAAIIILAVIVGLVALSELGINIAPLLAGAGVLGVAVGFGSQTLIKDFLTGLFIILEDTIAVGDVVSIGSDAGVVEGMTIRTVRLRDVEGNLHIMPFSEITSIINKTKGFAFALIDMSVAYDSDLKKVMDVMKATGDVLAEDPLYGPMILAPTEVLGVELFGASSITVRCRIKTMPGKQWDVRRAFYLRIKKRFDEEGIEIPFPTITHIRRIDVPATVPEDGEVQE